MLCFSMQINKHTVEPRLTTTLLIRPPHYYSHLVITTTLFWPELKVSKHEGNSPCDWSLQNVARTSPIV